MIRLLVLILVLLFLVYLLDRAFARLRRAVRPPGTSGAPPPPSTPAELTSCPTCGIHFLAERGRRHGRRLYCSERCAGGD